MGIKKISSILLIISMLVSSFVSTRVKSIAENTTLKQENNLVINIEQELINDDIQQIQLFVTIEHDVDTIIQKIELKENLDSFMADKASFKVIENGVYTILVEYEKFGELGTETKVVEINGLVETKDNYSAVGEDKREQLSSNDFEEVESIDMLSTIVKQGTIGTVNWTLDADNVLTFGGGVFADGYDWLSWGRSIRDTVRKVIFTQPVTTNSVRFMFDHYTNLTEIVGLKNLNVSNATDMRSMFNHTLALEKLDLSSWNVMNITDMRFMLLNTGIKEITLGSNFAFKFADHELPRPMQYSDYTGKWQHVGTGTADNPNGIILTHAEFLAYDGTLPGTYVWEKAIPVNYELAYNGNGGVGLMASTLHPEGEVVTLASNNFTPPTGTVFLGWSLTPEITVGETNTKPVMVTGVTIRKADITVYAVWATDANGNGIPDVDEYSLEITLTTSSVNGTITTWVLTGDVNRDGVVNQDDLKVIENHVSRIDVITDSTMLLAMDLNNDGRVNSSDENILAMLFDGTTRIPNNTFNFAVTSTPTTGYETSGVTINGVYYVAPAKGNSITVDGYTMTVGTNGIAKIEGIVQEYVNDIVFDNTVLNSITLTYHQNNGRPNLNFTLTVGGMIGGFTPVKEGHTFEGWYFTPDFQDGTDFDHSYRPATSVDLYAKWSINKYQVRFEDWNGQIVEETEYAFGTRIVIPTSPNREGYSFVGWTPEVETTMPARDVVYVATYTMVPIVTPTPSTPVHSTPTPEAGRTCQDDGYSNEYYWNGTACVMDAVKTPVVNQNPPANQNKPNQSIEEPKVEDDKIGTPEIDIVTESPKSELPQVEEKIEVVLPEETPLVESDGWSLINLIIMISSIILSILLLVMKKYKEEVESEITIYYQKNKLLIVLGMLCTVLLIVVFFLTQNLSLPMILVDRYTIIMVIIIIVNLPICILANQWKEVKSKI